MTTQTEQQRATRDRVEETLRAAMTDAFTSEVVSAASLECAVGDILDIIQDARSAHGEQIAKAIEDVLPWQGGRIKVNVAATIARETSTR